ncbi:MAG TPA: NAD-dependent epimerase/dehydratase family protein [Vicinamibacterales bacterium]|nr:NAD-dependent epimerase/dehydratase family protein [Vicinamibacterales bacterium]
MTGAAGFIGANLVRRLLGEGSDIIAVVRPTTNAWRLRDLEPRIATVRCDVKELPNRTDVADIDVIYHLAAAAVDQRVHDVAQMLDTNVHGTCAVLQLADRLRVKRLVHAGSSGEYGPAVRVAESQAPHPNAEYGATKASATLLVHAFSQRAGLSSVTLRPFSVFGPFESPYRLVPHCVLRALQEQPINITDGRQVRDYVYIDDVVRAFLAAATVPEASGGVFNICSGRETAVREMVLRIVELTGCRVTPSFGARPHSPTEMWTSSGNPDLAARTLDWRAETPLDEGLRLTIDWLKHGLKTYPDVYAE